MLLSFERADVCYGLYFDFEIMAAELLNVAGALLGGLLRIGWNTKFPYEVLLPVTFGAA